ncbi:MAG: hypothetical protein Q9169_007245, partial [Polycauliona sp. 2 TL-2023]
SCPLTDTNVAIIDKMFPNTVYPHKDIIAPFVDLLYDQQAKLGDLAAETGSKEDSEVHQQWRAALEPTRDMAVQWYDALRLWAAVDKTSTYQIQRISGPEGVS